MKILVSLIFFASIGFAQTYYTSAAKYSPTSTPVVITLQQPVTPQKNLRLVGISISCDATINYTIERNGTSATTTLGSYTPANPNEVAGTAQIYTASNVGIGNVIYTSYLSSGSFQSVALPYVYIPLASASTYNNITLRTSSFSGNAYITIVWQELTN